MPNYKRPLVNTGGLFFGEILVIISNTWLWNEKRPPFGGLLVVCLHVVVSHAIKRWPSSSARWAIIKAIRPTRNNNFFIRILLSVCLCLVAAVLIIIDIVDFSNF